MVGRVIATYADVLALSSLIGFLLGVAGLVLLAARRDARRGVRQNARQARGGRRCGRHRRQLVVVR